MSNEKRLICVAVITSAHGIKGAVKVRSFTEYPEDFAEYSPLLSADGTKNFNVKIISDAGDSFIAEVEGVKSRNEAEMLRGTELFIYRDSLPEVEDNEFYYEDLIGLEARSINGKKMGVITAIYNHGAGDILEVKMNNSGKAELVSFTDDNVPEINITGGYVVIHMPEIEYISDNDN